MLGFRRRQLEALSQTASGVAAYAPLACGHWDSQSPGPQGLPGYVRIDTVHQGDQDGLKGVYHINAVDMALGQPLDTQWQLVASVEHISEAYLLPVIALLLAGFPFAIRDFHSPESVSRHAKSIIFSIEINFLDCM